MLSTVLDIISDPWFLYSITYLICGHIGLKIPRTTLLAKSRSLAGTVHLPRLAFRKRMKCAILFVVAVGVGSVVAVAPDVLKASDAIADAFRRTLSAPSGARVTRQACTTSEMMAILGGYPEDCVAGLESLNATALMNYGPQFDPSVSTSFGELFCQPRCGNPLVEFYNKCFGVGDLGGYLANYFVELCAEYNDNRCYNAVVTTSLNNVFIVCSANSTATNSTNSLSLCPSGCQSALQTSIQESGCCVNILNFGGLINITGIIFEDICSVDVPGNCESSTLGSSAMAPSTMGSLVGALALLLIFVLQGL